MGVILIVVGALIAIFVSLFWGLVIVGIGVILVFVPGAPYGYGWYRGRGRHGPL